MAALLPDNVHEELRPSLLPVLERLVMQFPLDADAWITWPEWAVDNPKALQAIPILSNRSISRDLNIALSTSVDPQAASFLRFLIPDDAQKLMRSAGYVRKAASGLLTGFKPAISSAAKISNSAIKVFTLSALPRSR